MRSLLSQISPRRKGVDWPESLTELTKIYQESLLRPRDEPSPLVLVIDGLDELPAEAGEFSYLVTEALPGGVYFFVTSRPGVRFDRLRESLYRIPNEIHDLGPLNLDDMRQVLLSRRPGVSDIEVEQVAEVCQGNPLYLQRHFRPARDRSGLRSQEVAA